MNAVEFKLDTDAVDAFARLRSRSVYSRKPVGFPLFSFFGSKWRCSRFYPEPKHDQIVEPFAGSAGYSLFYADRKVTLVEKDPLIAALWRWLIAVPASEIRSLPDLGDDQSVDDLPISQEARWLIGFWVNQGSSHPCKRFTVWELSRKRRSWGPSLRDRIARSCDSIRHWRLIEGSYENAPDVVATWFVDPPYQIDGKNYRCSSKGIDFATLGNWCRSLKGSVCVCENAGADWLPFRYFRGLGASAKKRSGSTCAKPSIEVVWTKDDQS
jgi:hypothetical protein